VDILREDFEDVLCVSAWTPQFARATHGCLIAEINHSLDPLPEESVFKAWEYTQIGQRNINLEKLTDTSSTWLQTFDVPDTGGEPSNLSISVVTQKPSDFAELLHSLGLPENTAFATSQIVSVGLSETPIGPWTPTLRVRPDVGSSTTVFVSAKATQATPNTVQLVEVNERVEAPVIGGLLYVFLLPQG
jgi:hypothetical protein